MSVETLTMLGFALVLAVLGYFAARQARAARAALLAAVYPARPHQRSDWVSALSIPVATRLEFALQSESEQTRAQRAEGRLIEHQTGDPSFDWEVYIECDDPQVARWLGAEAPARALVRQLLRERCTLEARQGDLFLNLPGKRETAQLTVLAKSLHALARQLPAWAAAPRVTAMNARIVLVRALGAILLLLALAGGLHLLYIDAEGEVPYHAPGGSALPLLLLAGVAGLGLGGLLYRACLLLLRRTSRVPRLASELVLTLWLPVIGLSVLAARHANLHLPSAAPILRSEAEVINVYTHQTRKRTHYTLYLGPLTEAGIEAGTWPSDPALNQQLQKLHPARVQVAWRRGWLGSVVIVARPTPSLPQREP